MRISHTWTRDDQYIDLYTRLQILMDFETYSALQNHHNIQIWPTVKWYIFIMTQVQIYLTGTAYIDDLALGC